ncbi:MAG: glutamate racemase [Spirochaetaceae bacterium]|jgi:glutamate racemase|nr:glutamate racemase [Spirochaetaceae bacterium]
MVLFLDSGAGGLSYCASFKKSNPDVECVYIADTKNFPYGKKSKEELTLLLSALVKKLVFYFSPSVIVLACNTASVSALSELRAIYPSISFVGTVPAMRPAAVFTKTGVIGVLGTERTICDPYIHALLDAANKETGKCAKLIPAAAGALVDFIENDFWSASDEQKIDVSKKYINYFKTQGADAVVLGCTHFLMLLDFFKTLAGKETGVFDSVRGVCRQTEKLLACGAASGGAVDKPADAVFTPVRVFVTESPPESKWERICSFFGFDYSAVLDGKAD